MDCHGAATLAPICRSRIGSITAIINWLISADLKVAPICRSVTAIAHPTDSRLLEVARVKIVRLAQRACIKLKLTHKQGLIVGARIFPGNGNLRLAQAAG
jgi:hypothetical protein